MAALVHLVKVQLRHALGHPGLHHPGLPTYLPTCLPWGTLAYTTLAYTTMSKCFPCPIPQFFLSLMRVAACLPTCRTLL
eukprot:1158855-Pelagomonas_calceolata.AAC.13